MKAIYSDDNISPNSSQEKKFFRLNL